MAGRIVFLRGYAEPAASKFSRAKPHLNIGTIGACFLMAVCILHLTVQLYKQVTSTMARLR